MRKQEAILVAIVLAVFSGGFGESAIAKEEAKKVLVGVGAIQCGKALSDIDSDLIWKGMYQQWMQGFLSGINWGFHIRGGKLMDLDGPESLFLWVRNWCGEHPLDAYSSAVQALFVEIVDRQKDDW